MRPFALLLFAVSAVAQTTAGTDQTGSVAGVVTDAVTHMPVKKCSITAVPIGPFVGRAPQSGPSGTTTDASGAFTITNLQPGRYRLQFQQQSYPQARFGGLMKTVEVKPGTAGSSITVELIPGAAITGHITDEDGDPIMNCNVQIHPAGHPEQGTSISGTTMSADDGEYRVYGIGPGKYIVAAQCRQPIFQARPLSSGPDPPPSRAYPMQYYPMTTELKAAQVIELTPGSDKAGIDFKMVPAVVTQVHGAFTPGSVNWQGGNPPMVQLFPADRRGGGMTQGALFDQKTGIFRFQQVFPGSYVLVAFTNGNEDGRAGAWRRVDVTDRPVELSLELKPAMDIPGRIEVENTPNSTMKITPNQVWINLTSQYQLGAPPSQAQAADDGTFTLKGVMPGPWRLNAGVPMGFVKSAWLGSTDVTSVPMDLSAGAAGTLRVVISTNTATIRGSAPAGNMIMAQMIDDNFPYSQGSRGGQVDPSGQYKIDGLAPGKYRLLIQEIMAPMPDDGGQIVTVREGETIIADLKANN
jgi:hypothetical protein